MKNTLAIFFILAAFSPFGRAQTTPFTNITVSGTINGNTLTAGNGTLTFGSAKTLTVSNTMTLAASTDGLTLNIGPGGTLTSNAYSSTAWLPLTGGTVTGTITDTGYPGFTSGAGSGAAAIYVNGGASNASEIQYQLGGVLKWAAGRGSGDGSNNFNLLNGSLDTVAFSANLTNNQISLPAYTSNGLLKTTGGGGLIAVATSGTDYAPPTSGASLLYGNGSGGFSNATVGSSLSFSGGALNTAQGLTTGSSPTFAGLTLGSASGVATMASGVVSASTIGSSLSLSGSTFNTIQDIRTSASPTFVGGTFTGAITAQGDPSAIFTSNGGASSIVIDTVTAGTSNAQEIQFKRAGVIYWSSGLGSGDGSTNYNVSYTGVGPVFSIASTTGKVSLPVYTTNGLVKTSGSTGLLAIATAGTDYAAPTSGTSILYGNGSGGFSNATVGSSLSFSGGALNTAQGLTTGSSPTFVGGTFTGAITSQGDPSAVFESNGGASSIVIDTVTAGTGNAQEVQFKRSGTIYWSEGFGSGDGSTNFNVSYAGVGVVWSIASTTGAATINSNASPALTVSGTSASYIGLKLINNQYTAGNYWTMENDAQGGLTFNQNGTDLFWLGRSGGQSAVLPGSVTVGSTSSGATQTVFTVANGNGTTEGPQQGFLDNVGQVGVIGSSNGIIGGSARNMTVYSTQKVIIYGTTGIQFTHLTGGGYLFTDAAGNVGLVAAGASAPGTSSIILPTTVYGGSSALLGTPAGWQLATDGVHVIPYY